MYVPPSFQESDPTVLHDFMERHSFATLLSFQNGEPTASHLPLLLAAIVGFEMVIDRIEGKWKLNQNHPPERRGQIIRGLRATSGHDELQIAELMTSALVES